MKKFAILIITMMFFQTQLSVCAATKKYSKPRAKAKVPTQKKTNEKLYNVYDDSDYLLKYNIDDLDSAPWKNNGKRKI